MADTPFLLKPHDVAAAARAAMAEKRLGFQGNHDGCKYRYGDGACCAIGAALPDWLARDADSYDDSGIVHLIALGLFEVEHGGHSKLLQRLQRAHDNVCMDEGPIEEFIAALEACEAA